MALFRRKRKPDLTVIGIDGVPRSLLVRLLENGVMPAFKTLVGERRIHELTSVLPTVSSAAWTSFMTGLYPMHHGISGFINRTEGSYDITFPRTEDIQGRTIQQIVSDGGGRVFSMGVPVTSPPQQINGVMISCFLSPSLDRAVWPQQELANLKDLHYAIDPDPTVAHKDRAAYMKLIMDGFRYRFDTIRHYFSRGDWSLFIAHVMETDRLHHFFWDDYEDPSATFHNDFFEFYRKLDNLFEWIGNELTDNHNLFVLSDHGFCRLDREVNVGLWLKDQRFTTLVSDQPGPPLKNLDWKRTRIFNLIPGRIYVNLAGREPLGIVPPEEKAALLNDLKGRLLVWQTPDGKNVLTDVLIENEIPGYRDGAGSPDALLVPSDGMDLKDGTLRPAVFERKAISGMHTLHDASLFMGDSNPSYTDPWIGDLAPTILTRLGIEPPMKLDGRSLYIRSVHDTLFLTMQG